MEIVRVIGDIDQESFKEFSETLSNVSGQDVIIELMSEGGDPYAALAFLARIRRHVGEITVIATGTVQSAATLILAAGHRRLMMREAWVMVHETNSVVKGDVNKMERAAAQHRREEDQWAKLLSELTTTPIEDWERMHKETTYLTAKECLQLGLIDEII